MPDDAEHSGPAYIPATILHDPDLSARVKLLAGRIQNLTQQRGYCYASNEYLASDLCVSIRTIQRWMRKLRNSPHFLFETERVQTGTQRHIYPVNPSVLPHDKSGTPPHDRSVTRGDDRSVTQEIEDSNREEEQVDVFSKNGTSPAVKEVWSHYQRRYAQRYSIDRAKRLKVDACGRLGHLRARLSENYSVEELKRAIDGCFVDPWHADRQKDDLAYIIRNQGQVETFLKKHDQHGPYRREDLGEEEITQHVIEERDQRLEKLGY